jgi:predicted transcriptional regulator
MEDEEKKKHFEELINELTDSEAFEQFQAKVILEVSFDFLKSDIFNQKMYGINQIQNIVRQINKEEQFGVFDDDQNSVNANLFI